MISSTHPIRTFFDRTHSSATRNAKSFVGMAGMHTKRSAKSMHEEVGKSGPLLCKEDRDLFWKLKSMNL